MNRPDRHHEGHARDEPGFVAARDRFGAGQDSPRDFLERCLRRIDEREPTVRAFVAMNVEGARQAADAASQRYRDRAPLSPIDGMPIALKDIIETADLPTEFGSSLFVGWRGGRDAAAAYALRQAGAVIVGKAVTTEFAGTAPGPTRNPLDPTRTPGGSWHGAGRDRHPGRRLDHPSGQLLRRDRLQAYVRRPQPRRHERQFQPELPGHAVAHSRRRLGRLPRNRAARRRRSRFPAVRRRPDPRRPAPPRHARRARNRRLAGSGRRRQGRLRSLPRRAFRRRRRPGQPPQLAPRRTTGTSHRRSNRGLAPHQRLGKTLAVGGTRSPRRRRPQPWSAQGHRRRPGDDAG
ncbi:MAG: hypothetical protein HY246_07930 [Proteobacteria bacterium]|nr:hypothetical protein [Pseudomonadota bacterium]